MKVTLVGTNVELAVTRKALAEGDQSVLLSPEPMAAAYARISRSTNSIEELRHKARRNVEKSRRSNRTIVFEMGHASIAEHAVFNFDMIGLSRLAIEAVEHSRLASFTERSQRYVLLGKDYLVPEEAGSKPGLADEFRQCLLKLFEAYRELYALLLKHLLAGTGPESVSSEQRRELEISAREDARYLLPLATTGQVGMTINARSLESMVRRLKGSRLTEFRSLGQALENEALAVTPSLVRYTEPTAAQSVLEDYLNPASDDAPPSPAWSDAGKARSPFSRLCRVSPDGDRLLESAFAATARGTPLDSRPGNLEKGSGLCDAYFQASSPHTPAPRHFELVDLLFEVVCSACCFGQLKRHRMATIIPGPYDPRIGVRVPNTVAEAGLETRFMEGVRLSESLCTRLSRNGNPAWEYLLTNGHCRRVLVKTNLRELYHLSRLRMDRHAQWEISELAGEMCRAAVEHLPQSAKYLCGKDEFEDLKLVLKD